MLRDNQSISFYSPSNVVIWILLAFQSGSINIGGFMACHRFVSHVTGFATFFGYEINQPNYGEALGMLLVPLFFLLGTMVSAQLVEIRLRLHQKPRYFVSFGLIFGFLLIVVVGSMLGWFGPFGEPLRFSRDYTLLALLYTVSGLQNGTITTASKSTIRTTHLTGITTDLGIGLIRLLHRKKLPNLVPEESKATLMRVGIIVFFGLGSIVGGFAFKNYGYSGFLIPLCTSGTLFGSMIYFQLWKPRVRRGE